MLLHYCHGSWYMASRLCRDIWINHHTPWTRSLVFTPCSDVNIIYMARGHLKTVSGARFAFLLKAQENRSTKHIMTQSKQHLSDFVQSFYHVILNIFCRLFKNLSQFFSRIIFLSIHRLYTQKRLSNSWHQLPSSGWKSKLKIQQCLWCFIIVKAEHGALFTFIYKPVVYMYLKLHPLHCQSYFFKTLHPIKHFFLYIFFTLPRHALFKMMCLAMGHSWQKQHSFIISMGIIAFWFNGHIGSVSLCGLRL